VSDAGEKEAGCYVGWVYEKSVVSCDGQGGYAGAWVVDVLYWARGWSISCSERVHVSICQACVKLLKTSLLFTMILHKIFHYFYFDTYCYCVINCTKLLQINFFISLNVEQIAKPLPNAI